MTKYQRIGLRVGISTTVGVLVAAIAIVVAWRNIRDMRQVRPEQGVTRGAIGQIALMVRMYHEDARALPKSLEELSRSYEFQPCVPRDEKGRPLDSWGRPFLYSVDGTEFVITSLGRDGKPGGIGLDYDLSSTNEWPVEARPTFGQFLTHPMTRNSVAACLACGLVAFLVGFLTVKPLDLHGWAILALAVKLIVTILATLFVAFLMSFAEIPNYITINP
jgi:general secretion pathway protein G